MPPARRRWRRSLRAGLFWTALGLGSATITYALRADIAGRSLGFDGPLTPLFFALVPIPALALGIRGLALALRLRGASILADATAAYLADHLPEAYAVVPHYGPRDGAEDEVSTVVVGPPGVVVIEPRDETGEVLCYQDHWYMKRKHGVGRRIAGISPSQRARWNAARVRSDIATGGFVRTPVQPFVVFTKAKVADVTSSSVPVVEGLDAMVDRLVQGDWTESSPLSTRALVDVIRAPVRVAV